MNWINFTSILLSLLFLGCSAVMNAKSLTYQVHAVNESVESLSGSTLQVDLFVTEDRVVRVERGIAYAQVKVPDGGGGERIPGDAQIVLSVSPNSKGDSSSTSKQIVIKTNSGQVVSGGSAAVDPSLRLRELAAFSIESGEYLYGEEVVLGWEQPKSLEESFVRYGRFKEVTPYQ